MSTETIAASALQASVPQDAVTIAVSSSALFDIEGRNEPDPLLPGPAFPFVKALMTMNARLRELYPDSTELFYIVLMTNNKAEDETLIDRYGLRIDQICEAGEERIIPYLRQYRTKLYLSKDPRNVQEAIAEGFAAATMFTCDNETEVGDTQLRVAFDGDCVLFSDQSQKIMDGDGLKAFFEHERKHENEPLPQGPLKCFLEALVRLQRKFYANNNQKCPIRTYLVTSRSLISPASRVLNTLRSWNLEIDEALFLAGARKRRYLKAIRPHIFFDDQMKNIEEPQAKRILAAHVPYVTDNQAN